MNQSGQITGTGRYDRRRLLGAWAGGPCGGSAQRGKLRLPLLVGLFQPVCGRLTSRGLHEGARLCLVSTRPCSADALVWPEPRSYTGQNLVELHLIGCAPLTDLVVQTVLAGGARRALPGEFTMRAFLAGKLDLTQVEAVLGVLQADSRDDLKQALDQLGGGVLKPLQKLREDLLCFLADLEAGLDFADEDIRFVDLAELERRIVAALTRT